MAVDPQVRPVPERIRAHPGHGDQRLVLARVEPALRHLDIVSHLASFRCSWDNFPSCTCGDGAESDSVSSAGRTVAATRPPRCTVKGELDGSLHVPGSHRLIQELIESDLIDQINLRVFPAILGTGKVFEEKSERRNRQLQESKVVSNGVVVPIYERAA